MAMIEGGLAVLGVLALGMAALMTGMILLEAANDRAWARKLPHRDRLIAPPHQAVGSPALDDPEAGIWTWYDKTTGWHSEWRPSRKIRR